MKYFPALLAAALCACSYHVTTPEAIPSVRPDPALGVGSDAAFVRVFDGDRPNADVQGFFSGLLVSESSGAVRAGAAGQPLSLSAELKFDGDYPQSSALFGTVTLFIPPLSFVPETAERKYAASYALSDKRNRVVYRQALQGLIEGSFNGFYMGRIFACRDLYLEEERFAARNAARAILDDIFSHASAIADALRALQGESEPEGAPAAPSPAAAKPAEWWQTK